MGEAFLDFPCKHNSKKSSGLSKTKNATKIQNGDGLVLQDSEKRMRCNTCSATKAHVTKHPTETRTRPKPGGHFGPNFGPNFGN